MATTAAVVKLWQEAEDDGTPKPSGGRKAIISWAGDSRVYLLRGGKLERMTIDDTCLRDLVFPDLAKQIEDKYDADRYNKQEMRKIAVVLRPKEQADRPLIDEILRSKPWDITIPADPEAPIEVPYSYFSFAAMTKSLSRNNLQPNVLSIDVQTGDRIILNSDGVNGYALSSEMAEVLNNPANKEAGKAAEALVRLAKKRERVPGVKDGQPQDDTTAVIVDIS
jgi:serine/threonine protein phosphatase PrpC